jgi:hypothetical protein
MSDGSRTEEIIELTNVIEDEAGKALAFPDFQAEVKEIRTALQAEAEQWMATEGAKILERTAREMFPKIAAEILREEIARLKAEAEEKE